MAQTPSKYEWKKQNLKILANHYQRMLDKLDSATCASDSLEIIQRSLKHRIHDMMKRKKDQDQRMADNLIWLLYKKYPKDKFIIYTHYVHMDRQIRENRYINSKSKVEFLPDSEIEKSYCIGIFAYEGKA